MGWLRASPATVATRGKPGKCGYSTRSARERPAKQSRCCMAAKKHVKVHSTEPRARRTPADFSECYVAVTSVTGANVGVARRAGEG